MKEEFTIKNKNSVILESSASFCSFLLTEELDEIEN